MEESMPQSDPAPEYEFTIKPDKILWVKNRSWSLFYTIALWLLILEGLNVIIAMIISFIKTPELDYQNLFTPILIIIVFIVIVRIVFRLFFRNRKMRLKSDGLYINNVHSLTWDKIKGFYVKEPYLFIITTYPTVTPLILMSPESTMKLNLGGQCSQAQKIMREFAKELPEVIPGVANQDTHTY